MANYLCCVVGVVHAQMQMYVERTHHVLAKPVLVQEDAAGITNRSVAAPPLPESLSTPQPLAPAGVQQQLWRNAKASLGQHHMKQEPSAMPSLQGSHHASQSVRALSRAVSSTPSQSGMFIPTAPSAQRGLDHNLRNDRRSADRGAGPVPAPKFGLQLAGLKRPKTDSPERAAEPSHMHELVETDMF